MPVTFSLPGPTPLEVVLDDVDLELVDGKLQRASDPSAATHRRLRFLESAHYVGGHFVADLYRWSITFPPRMGSDEAGFLMKEAGLEPVQMTYDRYDHARVQFRQSLAEAARLIFEHLPSWQAHPQTIEHGFSFSRGRLHWPTREELVEWLSRNPRTMLDRYALDGVSCSVHGRYPILELRGPSAELDWVGSENHLFVDSCLSSPWEYWTWTIPVRRVSTDHPLATDARPAIDRFFFLNQEGIYALEAALTWDRWGADGWSSVPRSGDPTSIDFIRLDPKLGSKDPVRRVHPRLIVAKVPSSADLNFQVQIEHPDSGLSIEARFDHPGSRVYHLSFDPELYGDLWGALLSRYKPSSVFEDVVFEPMLLNLPVTETSP